MRHYMQYFHGNWERLGERRNCDGHPLAGSIGLSGEPVKVSYDVN